MAGLAHDSVAAVVDHSIGAYLHWHHEVAQACSEVGGRQLELLLPEHSAATMIERLSLEIAQGMRQRFTVVAAGQRAAALVQPNAAAVAWMVPSEAVQSGRRVALERLVYESGGCFCASGELPSNSARFWRRHYAKGYRQLMLMKKITDPADILGSTLGGLR